MIVGVGFLKLDSPYLKGNSVEGGDRREKVSKWPPKIEYNVWMAPNDDIEDKMSNIFCLYIQAFIVWSEH